MKAHYNDQFDEIERQLNFVRIELNNDINRIGRFQHSIDHAVLFGVDSSKLLEDRAKLEDIEFGLRVALRFVSGSKLIIEELIQTENEQEATDGA